MGEYVLDSGSELGRRQLEYLEQLLDGPTTHVLAATPLPPGARCLDLGAGGGSITRWMAEHLSSPEQVSAVDIDVTHLDVPAGVTVHRHDIGEGLPTRETFDLVHTRLLLMHLERRVEILRELVDVLAPGGRLVVGDQVFTGVQVVSAPSAADGELFRTVVETTIEQVGKPAGIDYDWAGTVDTVMADAGIEGIDTVVHHRTVRGGDSGMLLYGNYVRQVESRLLALGITAGQLRRFHEVVLDPRMRVWWFPFVCTTGRAPFGPGRPRTSRRRTGTLPGQRPFAAPGRSSSIPAIRR